MSILWNRDVLLTHSLTGKTPNAHKERDAKPALDSGKVQGICGELTFFLKYNINGHNLSQDVFSSYVCNIYFIYTIVVIILDIVAKKFGVTEGQVRQIMTAKISNLVKVQRAKERLNSSQTATV